MPFELSEFENRLSAIQNKMKKCGIECLIDTDPANIYYSTGYSGMSYYTQQCLIIVIGEPSPFIFIREMDAGAVKIQSYLDDEHIVCWPDEYANSDTKNPFELLEDLFSRKRWLRKQAGIESSADMCTPRDFETIKSLPFSLEIVPCFQLINQIRAVKSPAEIVYMKQAGQLSVRAMKNALATLRVGTPECNVASAIYKSAIEFSGTFGGDYPANPPMLPVGENTSNPHLTWSDQPFEANQALTIELSGAKYRYHAPIARTAYIGRVAPKRLTETATFAIRGLNQIIAEAKPGQLTGDLHTLWERFNLEHDLQKNSRIGYGIGCAFPPSWLEKSYSIRSNDSTVIANGMTFHIIIGIWRDDVSFEVSQAVVMTEEGFEKLYDFDQRLQVIN